MLIFFFQVEVKELLKIIEEIRRKYPEKQHITHLDILQVGEINIYLKDYHRFDFIFISPLPPTSSRTGSRG